MSKKGHTGWGRTSYNANVALTEPLEQRRMLAAALVKDIDDTGADGLLLSEMVEVGGVLYFFPSDLAHGRELWRSDGTAAGTAMVAEAAPGVFGAYPTDVEVANGLLFYESEGGLWRSDGTAAGTYVLTDARHWEWSRMAKLTDSAGGGETLLFVNRNQNELWKTDGTAAGTVRVRGFPEGSATYTGLGGLYSVGDLALFWVREGSSYRLWQTDGTEQGTRLSDPTTAFTGETRIGAVVGDKVFMYVAGGLWVHDPATGASERLNRNNFLSPSEEMINVGGTLFFRGYRSGDGSELWRSDGTEAGTVMVTDLVPGSGDSHPALLTEYRGKLHFVARDAADRYALWTSDGSAAGTTRVMDFTASIGNPAPRGMKVIGERLYLMIENDAAGDSVWVSDATPEGTVRLAQMPRDTLAYPIQFVEAGGNVFFAGDDGLTGRELWKTDGTPAGTNLVKDIGDGTSSSSPRTAWSFSVGGLVYFLANHGTLGAGLWRSDGTPGGTIFLGPMQQAIYAGELADGTVLFLGGDGVYGDEMWRTDGTPEGTHVVKDLRPGHLGSSPGPFSMMNGELFFHAYLDGRDQLWKTDGTEAGTVLVANPPLTSPWLHATSMTAYDGGLIYGAGGKLWASDGTSAGTVAVSGGRPGSTHLEAWGLAATTGGAFFLGRDSLGDRIWFTDGTAANTRPLEGGYRFPLPLAAAGGRYFFIANDDVHGNELWVSDGSDAGTRIVKDIVSGAGSLGTSSYLSPYPQWIVHRGVLLIELYVGGGRRELWRSDGTEEGTFKLPVPALPSMRIGPPFVGGGDGDFVFFVDREGVWTTDGTVEGTNAVEFGAPSAPMLWPRALGAVGATLLFVGEDRAIGSEVWKVTAPTVKTITGTAGDDEWEIAGVAGGRVGVWVGGRGVDEAPDYEYPIAEVASLRFVGLGGDDQVTLFSGASVPIEFDGGDGTDRIVTTGGGTRGSGTWESLDVHHSRFTFHRDSAVQSIGVGEGGSVTLDAGANVTLRTRVISIGTQGDLDVNDNTLVVEGGDVAAVEALVARGRDGLVRWEGAGIRSSLAAANPLTGLAVTRDGDDVIVKYAYNGDANVDGRINADDYFRIDQGFLAQPANALYSQGDFNYDGRVNADDYFLIDQAFLGQGAVLGGGGHRSAPSAPVMTTPERVSGSGADADADARRRRRARGTARPWDGVRRGSGRRGEARSAR